MQINPYDVMTVASWISKNLDKFEEKLDNETPLEYLQFAPFAVFLTHSTDEAVKGFEEFTEMSFEELLKLAKKGAKK